MLFDLRGRGRRRTVQAIYLGLALLMGGGLVLFGVGSGTSGGGLLNGLGSNGGNAQTQAADTQVKADLKAIAKNPNSAALWAQLVTDRWTAAGQGTNFSPTTGQFTAAGKKELNGAVQAWTRYKQLAPNPNVDTALLAARSYVALADYANASTVWEIEAKLNSTSKSYACLAITSYAAKLTPKGDLATAKAVSLVPVAQRETLRATINAAKTTPAAAQTCLA